MAYYRCHLRITSQFVKPKGGKMPSVGIAALTRRSAVSAASYRSGERLHDDAQGKWRDKNEDRKNEVLYTNIIAPEGTPDAMRDRGSLWNAVERSVLKKDGTPVLPKVAKKDRANGTKAGDMLDEGAQLFRECQLGIPREVWEADRQRAIQLVENFATENFVRDGMIADIAIHDREASDGDTNIHAHIMLTMRRLETDESRIDAGHYFKSTRERDWDCPEKLTRQISFVNKKRDGALARFEKTRDTTFEREAQMWKAERDKLNAERPINKLRRAWEKEANAALEEIGSTARVDHRTLAAQREEALRKGDYVRAAALNREPLPILTPVAKHIKQLTGVIADRANSYWASMAKRKFWKVSKSMADINRKSRAQLFDRLTHIMGDMMDDWRDNRSSQRPATPDHGNINERGLDR